MNFRLPPLYFVARMKKPLAMPTSPRVDYSRYESPTWMRQGKQPLWMKL